MQRPYVHREYPKALYDKKGTAVMVTSAEQERDLPAGQYFDSPDPKTRKASALAGSKPLSPKTSDEASGPQGGVQDGSDSI